MKKILFVASECVPFIKTGGLADVCGALPKSLIRNIGMSGWLFQITAASRNISGTSLNMLHIFI